MWSAAVDPHVLNVRAILPTDLDTERLFDARACHARIIRGLRVEHWMIDRGGDLTRLDVIEGTAATGPIALRFDLADDDRLEGRMAAIRALHGPSRSGLRYARWARRLLALQAVEMRIAGASLREIAEILLGPVTGLETASIRNPTCDG